MGGEMNHMAPSGESDLLIVDSLKKHFPVRSAGLGRGTKKVRAVDGVSFSIAKGETVGLVGESGCGKSTIGRMIMKLETPTSGEILFNQKDICRQSEAEFRSTRRHVSIVLQDPYSSLNPRLKIFDIVAEPI